MPAESKGQRKAAGIARAIQEGEMQAKPGTPSAEMAKMPPSSLRDFAKTSEKGLPEHKKEEKKHEGRGYGSSMHHGHGRRANPRGY